MNKDKNLLGVDLKEDEEITQETLEELSDGRGEDDE